MGILAYFKYANFFVSSFIDAFSFFGMKLNYESLSIILPVGISFYTFQTLSYSIDVWKGKLKPASDIIAFFSFVSFFPQLVAGPIERAENLLPQFSKNKKFNAEDSKEGLQQILWGILKKVVIADNCAFLVNDIFLESSNLGGGILILGVFLFAIQIYCDFSGYSDVAIGTAKLFGFKLKVNFRFPYFSNGISEFWKRWHISLSTWFRDYVYIPLGGSKKGLGIHIRNVLIVFLVSGLWHGAKLTYVFWGAGHALLFLPSLFLNKTQVYKNLIKNKIVLFIKGVSTFICVVFLWVFFRAESLSHAFSYINTMLETDLASIKMAYSYLYWNDGIQIIFILLVFGLLEFIQRKSGNVFKIPLLKNNLTFRWCAYYTVVFSIMFLAAKQQEFIYFQF